MASPVVSVGYEGRDVEELVASLQLHEVAGLVDVRVTPLSRKPGLSKKRLAATLDAHGIATCTSRHWATRRTTGHRCGSGDPRSQDQFTALLQTGEGAHALQHVAELLDDQTVALFCFERRHHECHRQLVVNELRRSIPALHLLTV